MTGASPVTTIHGRTRVTSHKVARSIVVTGLAPVMLSALCFSHDSAMPYILAFRRSFLMHQSIIYRPFEARDQVAARQLILNGLGEHYGFIDETRNPDIDNILENYITKGATFFVAQLDERIVGTGALIEEESNTGRIVRVSVDRAYRRYGIGRTLMSHLIEAARQRKYIQVQLETNNDWYDVIDFYKSLGFDIYQRTAHNVHMSMML